MKMKKTGKIFGNILKILLNILVGILFIIPVLIISLTDCIRYRIFISDQFKRLKNAGYKILRIKDKDKKLYLFKSGLIAIKFLPNEKHDISFDGGKTYVPIVQSDIGTPQEREYLKQLYSQYHKCDYRDRDMYDSTEKFIDFILENVKANK